MKYQSILAVSLIVVSQILHAQIAPDIEWQKSYGGDSIDRAFHVHETADGGYFVAGSSRSNNEDVSGNHGAFDNWLIRLDGSSNLQWQKCLGGSGDDEALAAHQTNDGGYILAGYSISNDGDVTGNHLDTSGSLTSDCWIVKIDSFGSIEWQKSFGGGDEERALSIVPTSDDGFIFAGFTSSVDGDVSGNHGGFDYWIVKLDSSANILWQKCLGGSGNEQAFSIQQITGQRYMVAGWSDSNDGDVTGNHGGQDYWIIILDSSGTIEWQQTFGGSENDRSYAVRQTTDGGFIVAGYFRSQMAIGSVNYGDWDYWVIKLDASGNVVWEKNYGGTSGDILLSIRQNNDGGFIIGGYSESDDIDVSGQHGPNDYWIINIDSVGNVNWKKCLGGTLDDKAFSAQQTSYDGFIITGYSSSNDGDVTGNHGENDVWVVHLKTVTGIDETHSPSSSFSVFPNPTSGLVSISSNSENTASLHVKVLDIMGREVYVDNEWNISGAYSKQLDLTSLPSGSYVLHLVHDSDDPADSRNEVKKLIIAYE